jgi:hypothetical protein
MLLPSGTRLAPNCPPWCRVSLCPRGTENPETPRSVVPTAQIDSSALLTEAVDWQLEVATPLDLAVRLTPEPGGDGK